jgi:hypothetical protein
VKTNFVPIARAFAFTLIGVTIATADSATENAFKPWPAVVAEDLRAPAVTKHFQITTTPAKDQTGAGTGGSVIDINIRKLSSGKLLRIEAQCVGLRVLESYNGFPQLEIWHHYGDGAYSRTLFRVEHGKYAVIREDSFDRNINDAARKDITASLPGGGEQLYFTGTGPGDWYQPDESQ